MALSSSQMLKALHKKDPRTLNKRFTPAQLKAAYARAFPAAPAEPPAAPPPTSTPETIDPTPVDPLSPEYIDRFNRTVELGKEFGQGLIDDLGMRGEFLGRVREGPSEQYYQDLANLRTRLSTAQEYTPLDLEALEVSRNALAGLDAAENQALRSRAVADINRQFGTEEQRLLRYQGGMGSAMQRAAQMSDLSGKRVDAQRNLARDILVENIQQKKDARLAFSNLTNAVGARTDARVQGLAGLLQSGGQFADTLTAQGQQFNVGTQAQEIAARAGALTGGIGTTMSTLGGYEASEFQNRALEEALKAKREEIEATKALTEKTLAAQQQIFNSLAGQLG